jgi:DNA-binding response OmpR family regulator
VFRRRKLDGNKVLSIENVKIVPEERTVLINEREIKLNRKEYDILLYLFTNKNRLVQKTALAEHVWGDYIDETDSFEFIYSQIKNLRKKLKDMHADIDVQAVYGIGYKLIAK